MALAIPNTLVAGTLGEADDLNDNFDAIESYVNSTLVATSDLTSTLAEYAKGYITHDELNADSATFTTIADITGFSVTFTGEASRRYRLTLHAHIESSVAGDYARLTISTSGGTVIADGKRELPVINESQEITVVAIVQPGAGSVTYKVQGERLTGTGNVKIDASATSLAMLLVEDIGL